MNAIASNPPRRSLGRFFVSSALAALLFAGAAAAATAPIADGVLIDEARGLAYVMNPRGGLDAVDAVSGTVVWSTREAAKPLLLVGGALVAQAEPKGAGKLELVALDTTVGAVLAKGVSALAADLHAAVVDSLQHTFQCRAVADGGAVLVAWSSITRPGRFDVDQLAIEAGATRRAPTVAEREGAVRFDLATGALAAVPVGQVRNLARQQNALWIEGAREANGDRRFASLTGGHQLTSTKVEGEGRRYQWAVSERASGRVLGTVESRLAMAPFGVIGDRLLFVSQPWGEKVAGELRERPHELVAFDLASGRETWAVAIRDSKYRGPFPP